MPPEPPQPQPSYRTVNMGRPHVTPPVTLARLWNALTGGDHNRAADRVAVARLSYFIPGIRDDARETAAFERRAARYVLDRGIRQFIVLGAGYPSPAGALHETLHTIDPAARFAYVDGDPAVVDLLEDQLQKVGHTAVLRADPGHPETVLNSTDVLDLLDLQRPVALLTGTTTGHLSDEDDPARVLAAYRDAFVPGSALVLAHPTPGDLTPVRVNGAVKVFAETGQPVTFRSLEQITGLFAGFTLQPAHAGTPARVGPVTAWRGPDDQHDPQPDARTFHGGVGLLDHDTL